MFRREDRATVLWGQLELPEVIVEATAPVQYTYYLDLDDDGDFRLEACTVYVAEFALIDRYFPPVNTASPA